jgi:retinol-binding protein 3
MSIRTLLILFTCLATARPQTVSIPDTPAGTALRTWLAAFNAADKVRLEAYSANYRNGPTGSVDTTLAFRKRTGGFQLLEVLTGESGRLAFRVKEMASPTVAVGKIDMSTDEPPTVKRFVLLAVPSDVTASAMLLRIDAATRKRLVDAVIAQMNEYYVFPESATKVEAALRLRQEAGAYTEPDADSFAALLNQHLQELTHDKHLGVRFSPTVLPKPEQQRNADADVAQMRTRMKRANCTFEKAEILPSNIGYLKFNAFADPAICGATAIAAMGFLANVDALIFDLRDNGGGDPKMVAFLSTYLFKDSTHLNDLYNRKENSTTQYWTLPYVPGDRLPSIPVFILTSKRTFSGAEEFSYNLKALKRATIVGEITGGGAHPTQAHRLDDHFQISVPFARAVNPVTQTNWEGTGVEPDVKVAAHEALDAAVKLARERIENNANKGQPARMP